MYELGKKDFYLLWRPNLRIVIKAQDDHAKIKEGKHALQHARCMKKYVPADGPWTAARINALSTSQIVGLTRELPTGQHDEWSMDQQTIACRWCGQIVRHNLQGPK